MGDLPPDSLPGSWRNYWPRLSFGGGDRRPPAAGARSWGGSRGQNPPPPARSELELKCAPPPPSNVGMCTCSCTALSPKIHPSACSLAATSSRQTHVARDALSFRATTYSFPWVFFLPEVREFITRHTAYNKHDTGIFTSIGKPVCCSFALEFIFENKARINSEL